jgi:hypothetical protein
MSGDLATAAVAARTTSLRDNLTLAMLAQNAKSDASVVSLLDTAVEGASAPLAAGVGERLDVSV